MDVSLTQASEALKAASQAEARRMGHRYVGTEHVLLAVSRVSGRVQKVLAKLDLDPQDLQNQLNASVLSSGTKKKEEAIPFSPKALRTFEQADKEAEKLGATAAGPEHVLLALVEDEEGVAARIMEVFAIDYASIHRFM
jgi:ATP-dependent Clp protease ATP-binding subunit ClpC|tara:strand:- start:397 stop:813 length:417 start_codon:yes stop_codon:yes gene_type:complete